MLKRFGRTVTERARQAASKIMGSAKWSQFKTALTSLASKGGSIDKKKLLAAGGLGLAAAGLAKKKFGAKGALLVGAATAGIATKALTNSQINSKVSQFMNTAQVKGLLKQAGNYGVSSLKSGSITNPIGTLKKTAASTAKYAAGTASYKVTSQVKSELVKQAKSAIKKKLG